MDEFEFRDRRIPMPLAFIRHHDSTWDDHAREDHVNGHCIDISKSKVDEIFLQVFGYSTKICPFSHQGIAVEKSEINYACDGRIIICPIKVPEKKSGSIYQRLVDNLIAPGVVEEFRVSIIGGEIADVIVKKRIEENRLKGRGGGGSLSSVTRAAEDVFSDIEIGKILDFCRLIGLEFGELDILPDVAEGRIYIVDANKTPAFLTSGSILRLENIKTLLQRAVLLEKYLTRRLGAPCFQTVPSPDSDGTWEGCTPRDDLQPDNGTRSVGA